jgi:periplasmic divalent cation tolerance protein
MTEVVQVVTSVSTREEADRLAAELVSRRLAGCVQVIGPISSTYHWQGRIETGQEWLCVAKSLRSHYPRLAAAIRELHSYEVPEILAFPAVEGAADYVQWLQSELASPSE